MQALTLCISTTMVLIMLGVVVLSVLTARNLSTYVKENSAVNLVLGDTVTVAEGTALANQLKTRPYAKSVRYISQDEALATMTADLGYDPSSVTGFNPFPVEIEMYVKADYANADSLLRITSALQADERVTDVDYRVNEINVLNDYIERISKILLVLSALLIFICYTLISNSVQLSVYAQRFGIHTMKLVGAKWSFIRRPFLTRSIGIGLLSSLLACGALGGLCYLAIPYLPAGLIGWVEMTITGSCVFVFGFVIMLLCTLLSVNHFLRMTAGQLYKI